MENNSKAMTWAGRVMTVLAALPFLISCIVKLTRGAPIVEGFAHLGWPNSLILSLGILEATCVILYLIPPFSVLGAILLTGYIGGAIATHLRIGEAPVAQVFIGMFIWGGLFLRDPRLRKLLPIKTKDFHYEREVMISRSAEDVFTYVRLIRNFQNWNPFLKKDPQAKLANHGVDGEIGYTATWDGNREMGSGEQEITRVVAGKRIEFELRFLKPFKATNQGYFEVEGLGANQAKVKWGMRGNSGFFMSLMGLVINCDKMIGGEFASGLSELKKLLEK